MTGARVLAADGSRFLDGAAVLVEDGRITAVDMGTMSLTASGGSISRGSTWCRA